MTTTAEGVITDGIVYDGAYSVTFTYDDQEDFVNGANTWQRWGLIPTSRPVIAQPTITSHKFVDIPGMHGSLDLSDYIGGSKPIYSDRSGTLEFIVLNRPAQYMMQLKNTMSSFLTRRPLKMKLEEDPNYYYRGRFSVSNWQGGADYDRVTIEYRVDPFKYSSTVQNAFAGRSFTLNGSEFQNYISPVYTDNPQEDVNLFENNITPTVRLMSNNATDSLVVTFAGQTYTLTNSKKSRKFPMAAAGVSKMLNVSGYGTFIVTYREAAL